MKMTHDQARKRYGEIVNGVWADEAKWCIFLVVPSEISKTWINSATGKPTTHFYLNRDISNEFHEGLMNVIFRGLIAQMKTFDGCFVVRDVRGVPGIPSAHSYALAVDMNAATNPLGSVGDMSLELAQCFIDAGFTHGRYFPRKDPMHFSLAWE